MRVCPNCGCKEFYFQRGETVRVKVSDDGTLLEQHVYKNDPTILICCECEEDPLMVDDLVEGEENEIVAKGVKIHQDFQEYLKDEGSPDNCFKYLTKEDFEKAGR
jgi:hypothetical protein